MKKPINRSMDYRRTQYQHCLTPEGVNREKVFADRWEKANEPCAGINFGFGLLQDLFMERHPKAFYVTYAKKLISRRERMIAATVVQWLGTNCGWGWLETTLKQCGFKLVPCAVVIPDKGRYGGTCNRTACREPGAKWFNKSTRNYYCKTCANLIMSFQENAGLLKEEL